MTDRELITRIVDNNDTDAFSVVVQRYSALVFSTALRLTKDYALAEEVMQSAVIKAYQNLHRWRGGTTLAPYLNMIVHNQAIDTLSKRQRERHSDIEHLPITDEDCTAERHNLLDAMDRAIESLSADEQQILHLHYYRKLKIKDIAQQTGLSESNILVRLHRIRAKLKKLITDETE